MSAVPAPPTTADRRARVAIGITFFVVGASYGNWAPRIPDVKNAIGLSSSELGLALFGLAVGSVISMQIVSRIMSRYGTRTLVRVLTPLACALMLAIPLTDVSLLGLFVGLIAVGAGHGAIDVSMNGQLIAIERRYRRPIVNSTHALYSLGGASGALTGGLASSHDLSVGWHFLIFAAVAGVLSVTSSSRLLTREVEQATLPPKAAGAGHHPSYRSVLTGTTLLMCVLALCAFVSEGAIYDWSTTYMRDGLMASAAVASLAFGVFQGTMAVVRLFADRVVHRFGPVTTLRMFSSIGTIGLAVGLLSGHQYVAVVGFAAAGLGVSVVIPLLFSAAGHMPSVDSARTLGAVTTAGYLGFFVGPPLVGFVADGFSLTTALFIPVILIGFVLLQARLVRFASGAAEDQGEARQRGAEAEGLV